MNTTKTDRREAPDIAAVRARLQQADAPEFWRSLDEVARTDEFLRFLDSEFPSLGELWREPMPRRSLLKMIGATLAAAGLAGCGGPPREEILPYADQPEEVTLGLPLVFATAMVLDGYATGTVVQSWTGKPTKVEGNPRHPASLGATDVFSQAWVLEFWDPDRSQSVQQRGVPSDWMIFLNTLVERLANLRDRQGEGLRVLTGNVTSPTLAAQLETFAQKYPRARVHFYHPLADDNGAKGAQLAFGEPVSVVPHFDQAQVVLSLDADFLFFPPGRVRFAHDFAQLRRIVQPHTTMNRLYVVESTTTITGAMADHRLPLPPAEIERVARAVAQGLGLEVEAPAPIPAPPEWLDAVTSDLLAHKGQALVVAGARQPPAVHLLAHAMNDRLGAPGKTLTYREPVALGPVSQLESLRELAFDMAEGRVDTLVMLGGNPVYDTPVDLAFGEHLKKVKLSVYHGLFYNATSVVSDWHIPATHGLEFWSDARAYDGTASIVQPLIAPCTTAFPTTSSLPCSMGAPATVCRISCASTGGGVTRVTSTPSGVRPCSRGSSRTPRRRANRSRCVPMHCARSGPRRALRRMPTI
jgi:MoCo/4Fe-4S cofactor protein with predicted Tat translocation signal